MLAGMVQRGLTLDQWAVREPAVAAHLPAVWVAYQGDELAGCPG